MIDSKLHLGIKSVGNISNLRAPHSPASADLAATGRELLDRLGDGGDDIAVADDDNVSGPGVDGLEAISAGLVLRNLVLGVFHHAPVAVTVDVGAQLLAVADVGGGVGALLGVRVPVDVAVDFVGAGGECVVEMELADGGLDALDANGAGVDEAAEEKDGAGEHGAESHFGETDEFVF